MDGHRLRDKQNKQIGKHKKNYSAEGATISLREAERKFFFFLLIKKKRTPFRKSPAHLIHFGKLLS